LQRSTITRAKLWSCAADAEAAFRRTSLGVRHALRFYARRCCWPATLLASPSAWRPSAYSCPRSGPSPRHPGSAECGRCRPSSFPWQAAKSHHRRRFRLFASVGPMFRCQVGGVKSTPAALSRQLSMSREGARSNQVSCCDGILPPRCRFGSEGPQRGPGDEVALKIECVVDGGMDAEEALGGSS
jgi:hypothetical protein